MSGEIIIAQIPPISDANTTSSVPLVLECDVFSKSWKDSASGSSISSPASSDTVDAADLAELLFPASYQPEHFQRGGLTKSAAIARKLVVIHADAQHIHREYVRQRVSDESVPASVWLESVRRITRRLPTGNLPLIRDCFPGNRPARPKLTWSRQWSATPPPGKVNYYVTP